MNDLILVITGTLGGLGFSLIFSTKKDKLLYAVIGSLLTSFIYVVMRHLTDNTFLQNLVSAVIGTLYCEISSRIIKAPVTIFLLTAIVPLVPGGLLYYTMSNAVIGDMSNTIYYGTQTFLISSGVAVGIVIASALTKYVLNFKEFIYINFRQKKSR